MRGAVEQDGKGERAVGRVGKQGRRKDRGARIDERHDLPLGATAHPPIGRERKIAASLIADAGRGRREQQNAVHRGGVERGRETIEIRVDAFDPHGVAVDVEERRGPK